MTPQRLRVRAQHVQIGDRLLDHDRAVVRRIDTTRYGNLALRTLVDGARFTLFRRPDATVDVERGEWPTRPADGGCVEWEWRREGIGRKGSRCGAPTVDGRHCAAHVHLSAEVVDEFAELYVTHGGES